MRTFFLAILLISISANSQSKLSDLLPGNFAVGFKTITTYDLSRSPYYTSDIQGKLGPLQNKYGREIEINIWYPAIRSSSSKKMQWQDYISELAPTQLSGEKAFEAGASIFINTINDLRNDSLSIKELDKLKRLGMNAIKNAQAVNQKFPLLLFPSYRSPATITILSEYLASNGYVVAAIDLIGTESEIPEISALGIQTMTLDLLFALNELRKLPFVNKDELAAIGLGINATVAFSLRAASPEVDALISLEGGILSSSEMQFLRRSVFYDANKFSNPSLFIYAPHPSIQPQHVDELKYGDKYFIHFPKMSEFYFLDYAYLEQHIPAIIGAVPGDVRKGFERGAFYVLQFLNLTLKKDKAAQEWLTNPEINIAFKDLGITKNYVKALPPIPSLVQLKNLITTQGITAFQKIYEDARKDNPFPFTSQLLSDLNSWLAYKRDPDFSKRDVVATIRVELYPSSARAHFTRANIYFQQKNMEKAKHHYNEALKLLKWSYTGF